MSWVYGIQAVESVLEEEPERVMELWIVASRNPGPARGRIRDRAEKLGVRFRMVRDEQLRRAVGEGVHQGVAARLSEFGYVEASEVLAPASQKRSLIVVLDRVQDPRNLGAVMRTAQAFGADGMVIPKHRAAAVTAAAQKVAAGAAARLKVARVTNLSRFLEEAKEAGYWVYGAVVAGGQPLGEASFADRSVLLFGAEADGVRQKLEEKCDAHVTLELPGLESLNVSVAAGIVIHHWSAGASG